MTNTQRPAPALVTWRRAGFQETANLRVDLAHGRSRGLTDTRTAQRIIAISKLGDLQLADQVLIVDLRVEGEVA